MNSTYFNSVTKLVFNQNELLSNQFKSNFVQITFCKIRTENERWKTCNFSLKFTEYLNDKKFQYKHFIFFFENENVWMKNEQICYKRLEFAFGTHDEPKKWPLKTLFALENIAYLSHSLHKVIIWASKSLRLIWRWRAYIRKEEKER